MGVERKLVAAGLAVGMVLVGAGCGGGSDASDKIAEKILEENGGGDVDLDSGDGSVKYTDDNGNTYEANVDGSGASLPEGWPENLAPPDDVKILTASTNTVDGKQTMTVLAEADGTVADWAAGLKGQLEDAGYTIDNDTTSSSGDGDYAGLSATGDYEVFASFVTSTDDPSKVTLTVTLSEPAG